MARTNRRLPIALVLALLVAGLALPAPAAANTWSPPELVRVVGGVAEPGVFAWGIAYDPVQDDVLVSDYLNRQVRRYDPATGALLDSMTDSTLKGFYAGVAVDPGDGTVYTHTFGGANSWVRWNADGSFAGGFGGTGTNAFVTFGADGFLYANNHKCCTVRKIDPATETIVQQFGGKGDGLGGVHQMTGVAVAANGDVYAVDPGRGLVHRWAADSTPIADFGGKAPGPGTFPGDARGIALDEARDRVYVADAHEGQIEVFTLDGTYVDTWAGVGEAPGFFPDGARELAVTPDGNLWAADYGAARVQVFAPDGSLVKVLPSPAQEADPWGFARLRDVAVDPVTGDVITADPWNQRVQRFAPDGSLVRSYGTRGSSPPYGMNYPRSVGVDPATGNLWVANYEGRPGILVHDRDGTFLFDIEIPQYAMDILFVGGVANVSFRGNDGVIRRFDAATGAPAPEVPHNDHLSGMALDPATGNTYVAFQQRNQVRVYDPSGTQVQTLTTWGFPWGVAVIGDVVYVSVPSRNEVVAFDRVGGQRLGALTQAGALGPLRLPSGLATDAAGNLYVSEAGAHRVTVHATSGAAPPADSTPPTVAITSPAHRGTTSSPVVLSGTAADAGRGVGTVEVAVKDRVAGTWWQGDAGSWGGFAWNRATVHGDLADASWRFGVSGAVPGGDYFVLVRVTDLAGNVGPTRASARFGVVDPTAPTLDVTSPAEGATVRGDVLAQGVAVDDLGVASVEVRVRDDQGRSWDQAAGAWTTRDVFSDVELAAAGTPRAEWSFTSTARVDTAPAPLAVDVRATDVSGNAVVVTRNIVQDAEGTAPPATTLLEPTPNGQLTVGATVLRGTATDDAGVVAVEYVLKDRATNLWWRADEAAWGGYRWNRVDLAAPDTDVAWEAPLGLAEGGYWTSVRAVDAGGRTDPAKPSARFDVVGAAADVDPPTVVLEQPAPQSSYPVGTPFHGQVSDDVAVASVEVAILDRTSRLWWNAADGSFGPLRWNPATLAAPGATSSGWSLAQDVPPGDYWVQARAFDAAGNRSPNRGTSTVIHA